jgi:peptidoglycan/LPS O-acetylase OafA/YrhL
MQATAGLARGRSISYRPDIDGLRTIAVLLVVVFHFHLFSGVDSGFVGVDVFFVISGYLITAIIRRHVETQRFSLATFWAQRLRRLAPALFVVLASVLAYGTVRLVQADFQQLAEEVLATQFYVANVYFWRNVNYFGLQADSIYLLHTWSLSVEEQFYIAYPLLLVLVLKRAPRRAPLIVLAAALVSFGLNLALVGPKPEATFYLMPTRAWELLIGALLTWVPTVRRRGPAQWLGVVGAVLLIAAVAGHTPETHVPGFFALLPALGAASLILAGNVPGAWSTRVLSVKPMVAVGRISYSLYLVHWPINVIASQELGDSYTPGWRMGMMALCFVVAAALYRWVESPFRDGKVLSRSRQLVQGYGAGLLASVVLCVTVMQTHGLPQRLPTEVARIGAFAHDKPGDRCPEFHLVSAGAAPPFLCALGAEGRPQEWLVWGDSHAWAAREAIDMWLRNTGQGGRFAFMHSCPPLWGVHIPRAGAACHALNDAMMDTALHDPQVKKVFLVAFWRQGAGWLGTEEHPKLSMQDSLALFQRQFDATVRELNGHGKEVYVWEPLPGARGHVPRGAATALLRGETARLDFSVAEYREQTRFFFQALERNRAYIARSFSPSQVLCNGESCASMIEGEPVYFDHDHLARSGSARWAQALSAQMGIPPVVPTALRP